MSDYDLTRLKAMIAVAGTATPQAHRAHAFSPGDYEALKAAHDDVVALAKLLKMHEEDKS